MTLELPDGWVRIPLRDLGSWYGGATPSKANPSFWEGGDVPWLSPKDMGEDTLKGTKDHITVAAVSDSPVKVIPSNCVAVVTRSGILERTLPVALVPFMTTLNQDMKAIAARENVEPKWIAWGLRAFEHVILSECRKAGTTVASIEASRLLDFELPIPPLAEQLRVIAAVEDHLSRVEGALKNIAAGRMRVHLARYALYSAAVEGRISSGSVAEEGILGDVGSRRQKIWSAKFRDKKYKPPAAISREYLPVVPDGWSIASLEALTDPVRSIRYGILMPRVDEGEAKVPYIEVRDLKGNSVKGKALKRTSVELDEKFSGARVVNGDVVMAVRGSYERSAVVDIPFDYANLSRDVVRISPLPGVSAEYLHIYLQSKFSQSYLQRHARGVAVKGVNVASLRQMPVVLPGYEQQVAIAENVKTHVDRFDRLESMLQKAEEKAVAVKRAILMAAFQGRLTSQNPHDQSASGLQLVRAERTVFPRQAQIWCEESTKGAGIIPANSQEELQR